MTIMQTSIKDLTLQFAQFFTHKDAEGIGTLLTDNFSLYDPALKWVRGKEAVVHLLKKQFKETSKVSYEVIHVYQDGDMGILEFKITMDDLVLYGVDFMQWEKGKMIELRCYYNPPHREDLKPFSAQAKSLVKGDLYEHYSGKRYKLLSVSRHSESLEECVVYQAQYGDHDVWVRPLGMFLETITKEGKTYPRFKRIESEK